MTTVTISTATTGKTTITATSEGEPNPAVDSSQFTYLEQIDLWGNDIGLTTLSTIEECAHKCLVTTACFAFTFHDWGGCFLKSGTGEKVPSPTAISGTLPAGFMRPVPNMETNGFVRVTGVDLWGGDLALDLVADSAAHCAVICVRTPGCVAFTFHAWGSCFPKSTKGASVDVPGAVSGYHANIDQQSAVPIFASSVGIDFWGNDVGMDLTVRSVDGCAQACSSTTGCNTFTFHTWGGCYLKSKAGEAVPTEGATSGILVDSLDDMASAKTPVFSADGLDTVVRSKKTCASIAEEQGSWNLEGDTACGGSKFSGKCFKGQTFSAASLICSLVGARLCTTAELNANIAVDSGCGLNRSPVWATSSGGTAMCSTNEALSNFGSGLSKDADASGFCTATTEKLGVRCCADAAPSVRMGRSADSAAAAAAAAATSNARTLGSSPRPRAFRNFGKPILGAAAALVFGLALMSFVVSSPSTVPGTAPYNCISHV
jgi:hypothetical protein